LRTFYINAHLGVKTSVGREQPASIA